MWRFLDQDPRTLATGTFQAVGAERIGRLYFPLVNEAGMFSWTSPQLQGGPARSHHEHLSPPLTAEDLSHTLIHRDVWIVAPNREPFSLAGFSPSPPSTIEAGPGWFTLRRASPEDRFVVQVTLWCPADLNAHVELMWTQVTNTSSRPFTFEAYAAIPMFARSADHVRDHRHVTALLHRVAVDRHGVTVVPTMSFDERGHRLNTTRYHVLAFGSNGRAPTDVWGAEEQFLGEGGTFAAPAAVWQRRHAPSPSQTPPGREAIGGFRFARYTLAPGRSASYLVLAGITPDPREVTGWIRWAQQPHRASRSLEATKQWWYQRSHRVTFVTADRQLNQWLTWVGVQPMLRRLYGNSYLPQFDYGRGGRGWRDLWQDCLALLLSDSAAVRPTLLHNLGGVRIDGSNATIIGSDGTFVADRNNLPRTWMDHGVWPTYTTLLYVDQTGDVKFVLRPREYFRDPQLFRCRRQDPRWTEAYGHALRTRRGVIYRGSVFEHLLVQNLTAFFNVGEHNVCRLEGADWNDGLDMARHRGESAAFSAFYAWNLKRLADLAETLRTRGLKTVRLAEELGFLLDRLPGQRRVPYHSPTAKQACLQRYLQTVSRDLSGRTMAVRLEDLSRDLLAKHENLARRIREGEWLHATGGAFFNGYYDDRGKRVEGSHRLGVRMTLTGQVFPIMGGIATERQVDQVIASVNQFLRDRRRGGLRLNTDFKELQRAFSFAYGEKENGAVFSHMAILYAYALYVRRRAHEGRAAWHVLYRMAADSSVAKTFPCLPEYFNAEGRGMYCYLTGSASWLMLLLLTQVYGIRGELGDLVIDPQLTRGDFGNHHALRVHAPFANRSLILTFENTQRFDAGQYAVGRVVNERTGLDMPFVRRPTGGVLISRRHLTRLPANPETHLKILLIPHQ